MTHSIAELDVVRHINVFEVPAYLAVEQAAGDTCVWCSTPLTQGVLRVDLGGSLDWRPHGCTPCYEGRRAWVETYHGWLGHMPGCPLCACAAQCDAADDWRARLLDAVQRAGKPAVACGQCHQEVQPGERFEPLLWDGNSAPRFEYTHIALCLRPRYCQCCGLLIAEGEKVTKYEHSSASAGGITVYLHAEPCKKSRSQTYPR
ncbi:hypothetical protein [Streptomyces graminilatus]|uniref:hypothetical protein n=1 Tax=Streptomyces graminilatus TaxID=1464070 RepID=UPI0006E34727|nr:hypothetical protein [Streptomyces graminilatus]